MTDTAAPLAKHVFTRPASENNIGGTKVPLAATASSQLSPLISTSTAVSSAEVDFVIEFTTTNDAAESAKRLEKLIYAINKVGLLVQVRPATKPGDLLIFVKCPSDRLSVEVYDSRSRDWLSGIRIAAPEVSASIDATPIEDSERLRLVSQIITAPVHENGAGITPRYGEWQQVASIFPLHDKHFNQAWLRRWSTKWLVDDSELDILCGQFGSKIAMYFAFLQFYLMGLAIPAGFGLIAFFLLPEYSVIYSIAITTWAAAFLGLWDRRQRQLAAKWEVRNCSKMERRRAAYSAASFSKDPVTDQSIPTSSSMRRLMRELLVVPFALFAASFLAVVLTGIFATEVFIGEVYDGPLKSVLVFTPTVLFSVLVGPFSSAYLEAAKKLCLFENHETDDSYNAAFTRKTFLLNFMTSYTALFLTLYVYLPFGHLIVPRLDILGLTTAYSSYGVSAKPFILDSHRLRNQLFYFAVTAQVVNFGVQFVLPIALRIVKGEAKDLQAKFTKSSGYRPVDAPEEAAFLKCVREEAALPEYDQYNDYAEMIIQFGYSVMFSPIWPLTPFCAFINNVIEVRADAAKLCKNMRRPVPIRADSIGPWADHLTFLTWLGSMTTGSILYLLRGDAPSTKPFSYMLAVCLFAEHGYLILRKSIEIILGRLPSPLESKLQREEYAIQVGQPSSFVQADLQAVLSMGKDMLQIKADVTEQKKDL